MPHDFNSFYLPFSEKLTKFVLFSMTFSNNSYNYLVFNWYLSEVLK